MNLVIGSKILHRKLKEISVIFLTRHPKTIIYKLSINCMKVVFMKKKRFYSTCSSRHVDRRLNKLAEIFLPEVLIFLKQNQQNNLKLFFSKNLFLFKTVFLTRRKHFWKNGLKFFTKSPKLFSQRRKVLTKAYLHQETISWKNYPGR